MDGRPYPLRSLRLKHQSRLRLFSVERGNAFYMFYTFYTAKIDEGRTPRNARFSGISAMSTTRMTSESGSSPAKRLFPGGR